MCSIVVALVIRLLYWIIYCTGLAIGKKKGVVLIVVVFVSLSYCLLHCFIIITMAVVAVGPSLSSLVDLDPYVLCVCLIVY